MTIRLEDLMKINSYTQLSLSDIKKYHSMDIELLRKELDSLRESNVIQRVAFKDIDDCRPFNAHNYPCSFIKRGDRLFTLDYDKQVEVARNSICEYYTITYPDMRVRLLEIETLLHFKENQIMGGSPLCKHELQGVDLICIHCGAVKW